MIDLLDLYVALRADNFKSSDLLSVHNKIKHDAKLPLVSLKSPVLAFILSFFLGAFGIDRFYLGQEGIRFIEITYLWYMYDMAWC